MKRYLSLIWVMFLLTGCSMLPLILSLESTPSAAAPTLPAVTSLPPSPNPPPTLTTSPFTVTPVVTDTATGVPMGQCGYMWATQSLPDVTAKLGQAYQAAGLPDIQAGASAFGENCLDAKGNVLSFSAMETDYYLTIPVKSHNDTQEMGDWLAKALPVLDQFPVGQTPGPNPGYVSVRFTDTAGEQNLRFIRTRGEDAIKQGLTGSALYNALANP